MADIELRKDGSNAVVFEYKPIWLNRWQFLKDFRGSDIGLIGGGVLSQRLYDTTSDEGKEINFLCPWVSYGDLEELWSYVNHTSALTLQPESAGPSYSVIFKADDPIRVEPVGGDYPDEDKAAATGVTMDRYNLVLNLIVTG